MIIHSWFYSSDKEQKQTLTERDKYTFSGELTAIYLWPLSCTLSWSSTYYWNGIIFIPLNAACSSFQSIEVFVTQSIFLPTVCQSYSRASNTSKLKMEKTIEVMVDGANKRKQAKCVSALLWVSVSIGSGIGKVKVNKFHRHQFDIARTDCCTVWLYH